MEIPLNNHLISQQWNDWIWSSRFSSFLNIVRNSKQKSSHFDKRAQFSKLGLSKFFVSSNLLQILFSLFFFPFFRLSICRITCDMFDPIARSRSQDLSDVPRNIWMANCSLYHRASPIEPCQQNGGCNSRLGIFNLSSTTWRNNTCMRSQSLRYCTNESARSTTIHQLEYLQQCKNIFGFSPGFACTPTAPRTGRTIHPILQFFPRISDSSAGRMEIHSYKFFSFHPLRDVNFNRQKKMRYSFFFQNFLLP